MLCVWQGASQVPSRMINSVSVLIHMVTQLVLVSACAPLGMLGMPSGDFLNASLVMCSPSKWGKPSVISGSAIDHHTETRDGFLVLHLPRWRCTYLLYFLGSLITFLAFPIVSQKLLSEFSFPQVNQHMSYLKNPEGQLSSYLDSICLPKPIS